MELTLSLYMYITVVELDLLVSLLSMEAGDVPNTLAVSWKSIPHTVLPCPALKRGEGLSLTPI